MKLKTNEIASHKKRKLFRKHIPERGGPASLGIYCQERIQQRALDLQQKVLYFNIRGKMITMILNPFP
jgi:hypothetical protein